MLVEVRVAGSEDAPDLVALEELACKELGARRGGALLLGERAAKRMWSVVLLDPNQGVWMGLFEGVVIGYAVARVDSRPGGPIVAVNDIFVEPAARGIGVGEALLGEVSEWSRRRNCLGMDVSVLPGDRDTKSFFETQGFLARKLIMHHGLSTPPA